MVSIIVPIYNSEKFLAETIQSVIDQTFQHWELLLIDDGSTNSSESICKKFCDVDKRINYHRKPNGGQASARNLGILKSSFSWIDFLDSDDLWTKNKLEKQLNEIEKHKADFVYSSVYELDANNNSQPQQINWKFGLASGDNFFKQLFSASGVTCSSVMLKKTLLNDIEKFDENPLLRGVEDWDLWLRIAKKSTVVLGIAEPLVHYRIHGGGVHHEMCRMFIGKKHVYEKYLMDKSIPRLAKKRQLRYVYRELMNHLYSENRTAEIKPFMRNFLSVDSANPATLKQALIIKIVPLRTFFWISNKLIYRVAYRLERLTYLLFLSRDFR